MGKGAEGGEGGGRRGRVRWVQETARVMDEKRVASAAEVKWVGRGMSC